MSRPTKTKALERLRRALNAIPELSTMPARSQEFKKWQRNTAIAIEHTFGEKSRHLEEFRKINYAPVILMSGTITDWQTPYLNGLANAKPMLESMIEEVEEYWSNGGQENAGPAQTEQRQASSSSRQVFVVHGRDEGSKNTVCRLLTQLDLKPVSLGEKANRGRTIIEKFEHHAQVAFAVVLLTPDDTGSLQGQDQDLRPRARQNVIFELGFFIGRLGRNKVCALTKGAVEIPSDYSGVAYIPFDDGGAWKLALVQELKAAGMEVDANLAF